MNNLIKNIKLDLIDPNAGAAGTKTLSAGTTDVTSEWIDVTNFATIAFLIALGAITSTGTINFGIDFSDDQTTIVEETGISVDVTDTGGSKLVALEVTNPQYKWARVNTDRGTANSVINAMIFLGGNPADAPVTHDASVLATDICQGIAN
jgi:hypothetical protein